MKEYAGISITRLKHGHDADAYVNFRVCYEPNNWMPKHINVDKKKIKIHQRRYSLYTGLKPVKTIFFS
jgi:hypothetical protein